MLQGVEMMKMKPLNELFSVEYPKTLVFSAMELDDEGINFVSSKGTNNGVVAKVQRNLDYKEYPANVITVPLKGTVLWACLQTEPCYVAHQIAVLIPKVELSTKQLMFYCLCLRKNKYRYNYGRQADKTLKSLMLPEISEQPSFVADLPTHDYSDMTKPLEIGTYKLDVSKWHKFRYDDIFIVKKGKRVTKLDLIPGNTPFLSAIDKNNGIREFAGLTPLYDGNAITVNYNGSVGEAFYQDCPFWASDDVNVLIPKFELNKYISMFLIALIRHEKYRFNYGRKWHKDRMEESVIMLPVTVDDKPDFVFMERYIKALPYSSAI